MGTLSSAVRSLWRRPAFASAVIATLALGVGANTAIFSIVDAVLLKPLPYPDPDRLVAVYETNASRRQATALVAPGRLEEWNRMNQTFSGLAASYFENMTDTTGATPERVEAMRTSPRFFSVLGTSAALGRTPTGDEELFGGPHVAVVSDAFWRKRLKRDPSTIGRALLLGGTSRTIIGVMPPAFRYPTSTTDVWIPTQAPARFLAAREARLYSAIGRLKAGVAPEQAQTDLTAVQARLGLQYPQTDAGWAAAVVPLKEVQVRGVRRSLWLLFGAVALLLVSACANVASLMLADARRREHQTAVRVALGAARGRLISDLFAEAMVLAAVGGSIGLLAAAWGMGLIRKLAVTIPRASEIRIDFRVVAFTLGVTAATMLAFAIAPAVDAARRDVIAALGNSGRTTTTRGQRFQRTLVTAQVALAVVLLSTAGLLLHAFLRLEAVSPGFDADHVLTFRLSAQWAEAPEAVMSRQHRMLASLDSIPGVQSAAFGTLLPAGSDLPPGEFTIEGRDRTTRLFAQSRAVSADYFKTLRIPVLQGETCSDDPATPFQRVVITRRFADVFFPDEDPIGHVLLPSGIAGMRQRIIGIVGNVRENGISNDPPALAYTCGLQPYWPDPYYLVRTAPGREVSANEIRAALAQVEPSRAMYAVRPLTDAVDDSIAQWRINSVLVGVFSMTTLLLAGVGIYGVLSQVLGARRREIGVRMALGARPLNVARALAVPAATMTIVGGAIGVGTALLLGRTLRSVVFDVSVSDPLTFTVAPLIACAVAGIAAFVPVRRATKIDPIVALRND